jgi:signal transduction histidine kinase
VTLPRIRSRLVRALIGWTLGWSLAVAVAVWLAAQAEVDELLDDSLQISAQVLAGLLENASTPPGAVPAARLGRVAGMDLGSGRFAWQVFGMDGRLQLRSALAPEAAWPVPPPRTGFSRVAGWRVYGMALGDGRVLLAGQTQAERHEAHTDVAVRTAVVALVFGLLGLVWLRARMGHELAPLDRLSGRLRGYDPLQKDASLGVAERAELQPVQTAIDEMAQRLARRVAHEHAFTAHAAHALRTPLAGIDAQLAVALREAPLQLQPRLQRVRDASARLQRVVAALLALFRSGVELQRQPVDLVTLLGRLPVDGLTVEVDADARLDADPDLLTAALLNLLDNAVRHGARRVRVSLPQSGWVQMDDDGPGVGAPRRAALQQALDEQAYEGRTGLGLMLADMVARAHGGRLVLLAADGFSVQLQLTG